jgi:hypothetical protein
LATNLRSSALNAKASTSFRALTVLVEDGKLGDDFGCKAHATMQVASLHKNPQVSA